MFETENNPALDQLNQVASQILEDAGKLGVPVNMPVDFSQLSQTILDAKVTLMTAKLQAEATEWRMKYESLIKLNEEYQNQAREARRETDAWRNKYLSKAMEIQEQVARIQALEPQVKNYQEKELIRTVAGTLGDIAKGFIARGKG